MDLNKIFHRECTLMWCMKTFVRESHISPRNVWNKLKKKGSHPHHRACKMSHRHTVCSFHSLYFHTRLNFAWTKDFRDFKETGCKAKKSKATTISKHLLRPKFSFLFEVHFPDMGTEFSFALLHMLQKHQRTVNNKKTKSSSRLLDDVIGINKSEKLRREGQSIRDERRKLSVVRFCLEHLQRLTNFSAYWQDRSEEVYQRKKEEKKILLPLFLQTSWLSQSRTLKCIVHQFFNRSLNQLFKYRSEKVRFSRLRVYYTQHESILSTW